MPELFEQLNQLADIVDRDEIIDDVLMPAAMMGRDEIRDTAPSGNGSHPEDWLKIKQACFASKGEPERDSKGPSVLFGVNAHKAPQAIWAEFGFRHIGWPKKRHTLRAFPDQKVTVIPPQPFFRPARAAVRPALANSIKDGLLRLIDKVVK